MKASKVFKNKNNSKSNKKSTNKYKSIAILTAIVCSICLLLVVVFKMFHLENLFNNEFKIKNSKKEIGVVQTLEGNKNSKSYELKYPFLKNENLNSVISSHLKQEIKDFLNENETEKAKLQSDYNIFSFDENNGISICFRYLKKAKKLKKETVKTMVFWHDKKLEIKNIFAKDKIKKVISTVKNEIQNNKEFAKIIKKEKIVLDEKFQNNPDLLNNFIIKKDSIEFSFNSGLIFPEKYGVISIDIENNLLKENFSETFIKINPSDALIKEKDLKKSKKPLIALTFDDGPREDTTNVILDELEKHDAKATFFVIGKEAKQYPEILKREAASGHEIANHTWSHKTLTKLSEKTIESEVEKTDDFVEETINFRPKLLRSPGGSINNKVKKIANKPFIYWSIDTKDWKTNDEKKTIDAILKNASDGDIILMHDRVKSTAEAVKTIIPELINRGFCLVTVSEMFRLKNIPLEKGRQYTKAIEEDSN